MDDQEGESRKRRRVPSSQRVEKQHSQPHVNTRLTRTAHVCTRTLIPC